MLDGQASGVLYGEAAVESWAHAKGIPHEEIEKARRCLK